MNDIESRVDFASKLLSFAFKVGMLIGGVCLFLYCYQLHYFPVGLSVGDGFLLILLATSFGIVYGLFVLSLTALGLWFTPILRPIQKVIFSIRQRFTKRQLGNPLKLVSPDLNALIFGIFGIIFISAIYQVEPSSIWSLPATSLLLAIIFATYQQASSKLAEVLKSESARIQTITTGSQELHVDKERLKLARTLSIILLFFVPLLVSGASGVLLEGGMRFANIKKGPSYVMLRIPYSGFIPSQLQAKQSFAVPGYTTFEGINVMFSGMGIKSVIEFKNNNKVQRIEIPNESILIVPR